MNTPPTRRAAQGIYGLLRFVRHPRYARSVIEPRLRLATRFVKHDRLDPLTAWRLSAIRPYTLLDFERLSTLRRLVERVLGLLHQRSEAVHLVQGWFEDTIPQVKERMGPIALLHLDGDLYQSTKTCLEELYPAVVSGGFVVIDDYGDWKGCRKAVEEYFAAHGIVVDLVQVDWTGVYFQKPVDPSAGCA